MPETLKCPQCGGRNLELASTVTDGDGVKVELNCLGCDADVVVQVEIDGRRVMVHLPERRPAPVAMPVVLDLPAEQQEQLLAEGLEAGVVPSVQQVVRSGPPELTAAGAAAPIRWKPEWGPIRLWQFLFTGSKVLATCEHCRETIALGEQCQWLGREQAPDGRGRSMHHSCFKHLTAELDRMHADG
jgi:hypothetical protein